MVVVQPGVWQYWNRKSEKEENQFLLHRTFYITTTEIDQRGITNQRKRRKEHMSGVCPNRPVLILSTYLLFTTSYKLGKVFIDC